MRSACVTTHLLYLRQNVMNAQLDQRCMPRDSNVDEEVVARTHELAQLILSRQRSRTQAHGSQSAAAACTISTRLIAVRPAASVCGAPDLNLLAARIGEHVSHGHLVAKSRVWILALCGRRLGIFLTHHMHRLRTHP